MTLTRHLLCVFTVLAAGGCATIPKPEPLHYYASCSGTDEPTAPVFTAIDTRLRFEPAFRRNFDDAMHIWVSNGVKADNGQLRFAIRMTIPSEMAGRKIPEAKRTLAEFSVSCSGVNPRPCVEGVVKYARIQPSIIRGILSSSPRV
jgi:hypothetical protein